jgi:hypothetical protein
MTALAKDTYLKWKPHGGKRSYVVKNGVTLYAGALVGTDANGYLDKWLDTAGLRFEGVLTQGAVGDTSASPKVEGIVDISGPTLLAQAVAGATTIAAVNAPVYGASDNVADLTLTQTTNVGPIGRVVRWISSGVCDVALYTPAEAQGVAATVQATGNVYCLTVPMTLSTLAADVQTSIVIPHAFKILQFDAQVTSVVTTGSKAATLNIEIGTTNLTGGTIALTSANCTPLGNRIAGSAITGANTGAAGADISIEASSITAFVEGAVLGLIWIQNLDS